MPLKPDPTLTPKKLLPKLHRFFDLSGRKILAIEKTWKPADGTPVFTIKGRYTTRGWTEWTQGFQFGSAMLQFDATDDRCFLEIGRRKTVELMASHVSHIGVHDHGFNNVSTYGNLLRLMHEGRIPANAAERDFYELALKISGAVQASRWTRLADGTGFIHSFNGAHSLFVDTIRSCRALAVSHLLGHSLMAEQDEKVSLLQRLVEHALNTARYSVYYGEGRDAYDLRGRTTHEAVFNPRSGVFRCPNSQQGYSPFSTWTRGLAWAICGFAEELEFFAILDKGALDGVTAPLPWNSIVPEGARMDVRLPGLAFEALCLRAATATADFYLEHCCADGIPMWDTGAPNLHRLPADHLKQASNPFNRWEPVDSSAAAIAAQGLIRLGNSLIAGTAAPGSLEVLPSRRTARRSVMAQARRYRQAGLKIADTLFTEPYLSTNPRHQGLLLHSVYHRPNGWDHIPPGQKVPCGESSMWGDYHARELALLILREAEGLPPLTFFAGLEGGATGVLRGGRQS